MQVCLALLGWMGLFAVNAVGLLLGCCMLEILQDLPQGSPAKYSTTRLVWKRGWPTQEWRACGPLKWWENDYRASHVMCAYCWGSSGVFYICVLVGCVLFRCLKLFCTTFLWSNIIYPLNTSLTSLKHTSSHPLSLLSVVDGHPELDLNTPATSEMQQYCPIHVAARYASYQQSLITISVNTLCQTFYQ